MKQLSEIIKDSSESDTLWWKPIFSMQRELNNQIAESFAPFKLPSFFIAEEEILSSTQRKAHRVLSEMFNNRQMLTPWLSGTNAEPHIDIIENGESFKINAEIPKLKAENLDILVSNCAITIKGSKQEKELNEGDSYIRQECYSGAFSRVISMPEEADLDRATAIFKDNILKIEIPKKTDASLKGRKLIIEDDDRNLPAIPLNLSPEEIYEKRNMDKNNSPKET